MWSLIEDLVGFVRERHCNASYDSHKEIHTNHVLIPKISSSILIQDTIPSRGCDNILIQDSK